MVCRSFWVFIFTEFPFLTAWSFKVVLVREFWRAGSFCVVLFECLYDVGCCFGAGFWRGPIVLVLVFEFLD